MTSISHVSQQQNTFVVASPAPDKGASLAELQAARAAWLNEAAAFGYVDSCKLIAEYLGGAFEPAGWSTWEGFKFEAGQVRITLYRGAGAYRPSLKRFSEVSRLVVTVGGLQAVNYKTVDGEPDKDSWFVPGQWLQVVFDNQARAAERAESARLAEQEAERRQLARRLLIGEAI